MKKSTLISVFGIALATTVGTIVTPIKASAFTFDYSKVKNFSARPIVSNDVLTFFGDIADNEGYITSYNLDPTAPDAGHLPISINGLGYAGYYTTGRQGSPLANGATRTASLELTQGFSNFASYLATNGIPLRNIGFSYGQKEGLDFKSSWNLGEDKLGQDWFASPDSPVEERIYRANPDEVEMSLSLGETKIVLLGYSDVFFVADNGDSPDFTDNFNVIILNPVPVTKIVGLDPLYSGAADAFLKDVALGGGRVQFVSEDPNLFAEFTELDGFAINNINLPFTLSAVAAIPEKSSVLSLLTLAGVAILLSCFKKLR
jgi:hypothetical protein